MKRLFSGFEVSRLLVVTLLALSPYMSLQAAEVQLSDEEMQRIKEAVMLELRNSDFLKQEIEAGILDYIANQQRQQAEAQAAQQRQLAERAKNVRRVSERDHVLGNLKAEVSIIEYSDFECPYCQAFHQTPKVVLEQYQGRVNWVYRHFPLEFHNPVAQKTAEASECVTELGGNEAFWFFTDAIYERGPVNDEGRALNDMRTLVAQLGIDQASFDSCLESSKYRARVIEDLEEGSRIGINGTPGTVLLHNENGAVRLISGAVPPESLAATIEQLLN